MKAITIRSFPIIAIMLVFLLAFSQTAGVGQAKYLFPPKERVDITQVSLGEVQTFYGRLADRKGPIGVVIELEDTPAALIYAQNQKQLRTQAVAQVKNQIDQINRKQNEFVTALRNKGVRATELFRTQKVYNGIWMRVEVDDLAKLQSIPGVKAIHPIIPKKLDHTTSVPLIGAPQVWGGVGNYLGEGIRVGVIDTGIDYIHKNFGGSGIYVGQDFTTLDEPVNDFPTAKVVGGWDFVGDDYDAETNPIPAPDPDPMDCHGHGSHVAGTIAGFGVLSDGSTYQESGTDTYAALKGLGLSAYVSKFRIGPGVAPKAKLYALRVFGCGGSTEVTEQAIEWAVDPNNDGDFSDHLDVINMSLGSSFGTEYDTSAIASNNAAQAGVLVVASAGNSGDVYYITGSPAVARYAISVASSVDSGAVVSAFEVTAAPSMTPGNYPAVEAAFGPQTFGVTGDLAYATPANGCSAISGVSGKIALIDRGACTFVTKVKNAQTAGAIGVLVANNVDGFPFAMGGEDPTITIPSMLTTKAIGTQLKSDLLSGTVTVKLTSQHRDQFTMTDSGLEDTISSFTSRGPARYGTYLKPDVTAIGDTVFSTKALSRNQGVSFNGTSMSAPHVAGVVALLKQMHPTWSVAELKALTMNTAINDLYTGANRTGSIYTPTRIGAGRVSVSNAARSNVVAFNKEDPGQVSLAFGEVEVVDTSSGVDQSLIKTITIKNFGSSPASYNITFDSRYQSNPGLTFTLLDASNAALTNPVTVGANSALDIKVKVDIDAATLTRARDATISTAVGRQRFSEGGGYIVLTSTDSAPALRVPVHIAARPASSMGVLEHRINLPAATTGTFSLHPAGTPVDTSDDISLVSILELMDEDPNETSSVGPNEAADLRYIGATSDYPIYSFADAAMYFGVATYGRWDTPNSVEFDIYIDVNEDGSDDFVVFNTNLGFFTGVTDDVMLSAFCDLSSFLCDAWYYVNGLSGSTNTNLFRSNVMTLVVPLGGIGLVEGSNTDFDFYVVSYSREAPGAVDVSEIMSYDVANQSFITVDPVNTGMPLWLDASVYSPTFDIVYDKNAIEANDSKGLLLLHHHNSASTAEILDFNYRLYMPTISR